MPHYQAIMEVLHNTYTNVQAVKVNEATYDVFKNDLGHAVGCLEIKGEEVQMHITLTSSKLPPERITAMKRFVHEELCKERTVHCVTCSAARLQFGDDFVTYSSELKKIAAEDIYNELLIFQATFRDVVLGLIVGSFVPSGTCFKVVCQHE